MLARYAKNFVLRFLTTLLAVGSAAPAIAARADRRGARQRARIREGVKSGELSKQEAQGLRQEQRDIRQDKRDARADGKFTAAERKDINHKQNEASQNIHEEKHDAEKR